MLYEHYADALYGVIKKIISDNEIAADALQETFIKIWKKANTYNPEKAKLFTWLYRIAYNTAIDKVRSLKNKSSNEIQLENSNVYKLSTNSINEEILDLEKHLKSIDKKYQTVIEALFFEGLTHEQASEALNIPLGTVKSRLKIGLRELKKIYQPESNHAR